MKGTSKVIMGATLVMVVILALVLGLVLVLLAELYCSLLLRRRQLRSMTSNTTAAATADSPDQPRGLTAAAAAPNSSFFAQGVLRAPRGFLFPSVSGTDNVDIEKQHSQPKQVFESQTEKPNSISRQAGLSPPSASFTSVTSPQPVQKVPSQCGSTGTSSHGLCGGCREHLVYISNPIYDNEDGRPSRADTPFETPDTSPSRLEMGGSSGDEDRDQSIPSSPPSLPTTPPLTPMKKLPSEACSVSLRDARSLGTSGSDSNSNNGRSSSSSGTPCTSPSW